MLVNSNNIASMIFTLHLLDLIHHEYLENNRYKLYKSNLYLYARFLIISFIIMSSEWNNINTITCIYQIVIWNILFKDHDRSNQESYREIEYMYIAT